MTFLLIVIVLLVAGSAMKRDDLVSDREVWGKIFSTLGYLGLCGILAVFVAIIILIIIIF